LPPSTPAGDQHLEAISKRLNELILFIFFAIVPANQFPAACQQKKDLTGFENL
jgi:hypothetical protein